ncbi:TPA: ATP-binding cassette domain-containing protein, partial [Klebsiella pneumoniae]|nr:ATP-binding cassette domain-containing protein [Klebsiella pneumoniae]
MIEISKISKCYQDTTVLDNITTTIQRGGITSIIGPNGAGKSTLLSVIGRLLMPESGMVSVNGMDVAATESDVLAKNLSILRQENQFVSRLTVEE